MKVKEFTAKYLDSLSIRFPTARFAIIDDSTINAKLEGKDVRISVDNAYREYQAEPDSLQEILHRYILVSSEIFNPKEKISVDRIIPIIKPVEYLNDLKNLAKNMGATKDFEGVYEKYNEQLIIVYAEDTKSSLSYLTQDDLTTLSINQDSLRMVATKNLDRLLTNIQRQGDDGTYMLTAGGNYETSMILLNNIFTKESLPVNGDFVVAIPNRDMLLITGSNDKTGIQKIKEISTKTFQTGDHQVSEYLYKWNGHKFEKFE
jgi:uncharacterized protein YtpQ (UPF0354 family)